MSSYLPSTTRVQGLSAMAKLLLPKATENQALLGPEMVIVASPPATLAFNLTLEVMRVIMLMMGSSKTHLCLCQSRRCLIGSSEHLGRVSVKI